VTEREELIRVSGVSFGYDGNPVLRDVSFSILTGDFLAILGPNGSGKTTLIKLILGLLKPQEGEILIMGKTLPQFSEWTKIGYVPQKATHFDPSFPASVKETVAMGLFSNKHFARLSKEDDRSILQALVQVGMQEFKNQRIGSLSGGQQQRVFIARALVNHPCILFLDEPTTGVDAETQGKFYEMLDGLNHREGITIVLVTHDIGIVDRHVNQVACLNQKLVYHGSHTEFCKSAAFREMLVGGHHVVSHQH
jgi:zinc transport system ATP-binding protein